jgi:hypothetical protein
MSEVSNNRLEWSNDGIRDLGGAVVNIAGGVITFRAERLSISAEALGRLESVLRGAIALAVLRDVMPSHGH